MRLNLFTIPLFIIVLTISITFVPYVTGSAVRSKLGEINADMTGDGIEERIVKVKINQNGNSRIVLEVYENEKLKAEITLPKAHDANFTFKNKRGNLMVADIDSDGLKDILTVSRDKNDVSVISVLTYKKGVFTTKI